MKTKKILSVITAATLCCFSFMGCTEAKKVSYNVSQNADNFNVIRRLTVMNARTDTVMFELEGAFSISVDNADKQLEVICETENGVYKKHFIGLNEYTMYVIEDIDGADVDKYHYTVNYLPTGNIFGFNIKGND